MVDLSRYTFENAESYHVNVGQWISLVAARIPRARILVVPTHVDKCRNDEEIDLKCRNIVSNMKQQQEDMENEVSNMTKRVRKREHSTPSDELAKILEQLQKQKANLPAISLQYKVR